MAKPGEQEVIENEVFKSLKAEAFKNGDVIYENCEFVNCDLSYADLSNQTFINCSMQLCNLSLVRVNNAGFQNVVFKECKVTGVNFSHTNSFSFAVAFEGCTMDYSVFQKRKMKDTRFDNCLLRECDFSEADLSNAKFKDCDMTRAVFNRTILKGADFTSANYYHIDPENNTMAKAKFSLEGLPGLLTKYNLIIEQH
jgi:fluoroquinolone resistance protein